MAAPFRIDNRPRCKSKGVLVAKKDTVFPCELHDGHEGKHVGIDYPEEYVWTDNNNLARKVRH